MWGGGSLAHYYTAPLATGRDRHAVYYPYIPGPLGFPAARLRRLLTLWRLPSGKFSKALEKEQPGLCSFLDMGFRERLFQALG
jgi:hypothetical protein